MNGREKRKVRTRIEQRDGYEKEKVEKDEGKNSKTF